MSSTLILAIIVGVVQLAAGVVIGRYSPWRDRRADRETVDPARLHRFARNLRHMATRMANDVGQHQTQMEQVNKELHSLATADEPGLIRAVLDTISDIIQINERLEHKLNAAEQKLDQQARQMESHITEARTDPLTELPNRRAFDDELLRRMAEWNRKRVPFCLLMIDVDHFKKLNDRHGHPMGDHVLRSLADILKRTAREMDLVARVGGEEFAVILANTTPAEGNQASERLRAAVASQPFCCDQTALHVTLSLGLTAVQAGDDYTTLMRRADEALYASKRAGRNCGHFHNGLTCEPIRWDTSVASAPLSTVSSLPQTLAADDPVVSDDAELLRAVGELRSRLKELDAE